jgi:hypothetical protein
MYAICPAMSVFSAFWTVLHGLLIVPAFESEPEVET